MHVTLAATGDDAQAQVRLPRKSFIGDDLTEPFGRLRRNRNERRVVGTHIGLLDRAGRWRRRVRAFGTGTFVTAEQERHEKPNSPARTTLRAHESILKEAEPGASGYLGFVFCPSRLRFCLSRIPASLLPDRP